MSQGSTPCDIFFYSLSKNYTRGSPQMTFINHTKGHFFERQASRLSFQATYPYPIYTMALRRYKTYRKLYITNQYNTYLLPLRCNRVAITM